MLYIYIHSFPFLRDLLRDLEERFLWYEKEKEREREEGGNEGRKKGNSKLHIHQRRRPSLGNAARPTELHRASDRVQGDFLLHT